MRRAPRAPVTTIANSPPPPRGVIAEKTSEALFVIDPTGSAAIRRSYEKTHKPLKADQILAQRSLIPPIDTRKRPGVTDGVLPPSTKRRKGNGVKPEEYERLRARAYGGAVVLKDGAHVPSDFAHDPWATGPETPDPQFSFLEAARPVRAPPTLKAAPISLLASGKPLPAVPAPGPGTSYNPTFHDWDALLAAESAAAVAAERARMADARAEAERQARVEAAAREESDDGAGEESMWEGIESEPERDWTGRRPPRRKTPAERNRARRRKEAERLERHLARMRPRDRRAEGIAEIGKELAPPAKEADGAVDKAKESSDEELDDRVLRRRKFGKAA
jgi:nucleolar protein 53